MKSQLDRHAVPFGLVDYISDLIMNITLSDRISDEVIESLTMMEAELSGSECLNSRVDIRQATLT